jgi:hypothetical protein
VTETIANEGGKSKILVSIRDKLQGAGALAVRAFFLVSVCTEGLAGRLGAIHFYRLSLADSMDKRFLCLKVRLEL